MTLRLLLESLAYCYLAGLYPEKYPIEGGQSEFSSKKSLKNLAGKQGSARKPERCGRNCLETAMRFH